MKIAYLTLKELSKTKASIHASCNQIPLEVRKNCKKNSHQTLQPEYCRVRCCCAAGDVAHHASKATFKILFFIIVIVFNRSYIEFYPTRKKWFCACHDVIFSDFPIFSFHRKIRTFPKKFLTVFLINRIDKFIKILVGVKF